jgi:uncharacterized protein (TIGR02246 family)
VIARYAFFFVLALPVGSAQETFRSAHSRDMAAIERLHNRDAAAAKAGDLAALAELWADDAVALPPGEPPVIGIDAIRRWLAASQPAPSKVEILEYLLHFNEVKVFGDEAIEWGRICVTVRPHGATSSLRSSGNLMRVLKRQPDGSWKVFRSVWNIERPVPEKP